MVVVAILVAQILVVRAIVVILVATAFSKKYQ